MAFVSSYMPLSHDENEGAHSGWLGGRLKERENMVVCICQCLGQSSAKSGWMCGEGEGEHGHLYLSMSWAQQCQKWVDVWVQHAGYKVVSLC